MICFKKNIFTFLIKIVSFIVFNCVMAPSNEGFWRCCEVMGNNFLLLRKRYMTAEEARINCIKFAILNLSENDDHDPDLKNYYTQFPGHANPSKIKYQTQFCTEIITKEDSEVPVQVNPGDLLSHHQLEALTGFQVRPGELISHQQIQTLTVNLYLKKEDEIQECVDQLSVFGSSKEEILDKAIRIFKSGYIEGNNYSYAHAFGYQYLHHIKNAVELKTNSDLLNPWDYCCGRHPDDKLLDANPVGQASSSNQ